MKVESEFLKLWKWNQNFDFYSEIVKKQTIIGKAIGLLYLILKQKKNKTLF